MKVLAPLVLMLSLGAALSPVVAASRYNSVQLPDAAQEAKAKELMETIRCVVCQGQSIADSNADLAADMRGLIRDRISTGEDPESIRAWLIEHYGDWVSFKPQLTGNTLALWIVPLLTLLAGILLIAGRIKRRGVS
jgi:cytochrome c-type biogenesis protein CcmH